MAAKKYLVPIDFSPGSRAAVKYAVKLARRKKGKLVLLHVVPLVFNMGTVAAYLRSELEALAKRVGLKANEYSSLVQERGEVAQAIVETARKSGAEMIIMGGHGRSGWHQFILGSVAERTVRMAKCPVLVIKK